MELFDQLLRRASHMPRQMRDEEFQTHKRLFHEQKLTRTELVTLHLQLYGTALTDQELEPVEHAA